MIYLNSFQFPDDEVETSWLVFHVKRTCYDSFYPFKMLSAKAFERMDFEPITILYGGNGSGKTTALNIIAEKLRLRRDAAYNRSSFFEDYVDLCSAEAEGAPEPEHSRIITSDDVFDYMLNIRALNGGIDGRRDELLKECLDYRYNGFRVQSIDDYEELKRANLARNGTQSSYVRNTLMENVREWSNGESAFRYFTDKITSGALYLLDEPENSLSAKRQTELAEFLSESAKYFKCQFVISTHSPFLLAIPGAKIYDMDASPVDVKCWTELANIRIYHDFFLEHEDEFDEYQGD